MNIMNHLTHGLLFKILNTKDSTSISMMDPTVTFLTNQPKSHGLHTTKNQRPNSTFMTHKLEPSFLKTNHPHMLNTTPMINTVKTLFNINPLQFNGITTMKNPLLNSMDSMNQPANTTRKTSHPHTLTTTFGMNHLKTSSITNHPQLIGLNTTNNQKPNFGVMMKHLTLT